MAESVAEILLRITSDVSAAKRGMSDLADDVEQFDRTEAAATADVDDAPAQRKLKDLFREFARVAKEKVTATVDAATEPAERGIQGIKARLASIRDERVEVDVDTDRAETALARLSARLRGGGDGFRDLAGGIRSTYTILIGLLIPGIISLIGTLAPLAATVTGAALALGALGVAAGGVMVPAMLLATAVIDRFKRTSKFVGTAANDLKREFQDFAGVLRRSVAPAAGAVLEGLTGALRTIMPLARELAPVFERLGNAIGASIGLLANQLVKATPMFERLTALASGAIRPLTRIFVNLARVLLNIAVAAMPFLVDGLRLVADETRRWVRETSDVGRMRGLIRGFIRDLAEVAEFARQAGRLVLAFFNAFRGPGRQAAGDLTELVRQTADWAESARGQREIREFFSATFFAIRDLGNFIRTYGPAIGAFFVTFGKSATVLMKGFNALPSEAAKVVGALAGLAVFGKALAAVFSGLVLPVVRALGAVFTFLGQRLLFGGGAMAALRTAAIALAAPIAAVIAAIGIVPIVIAAVVIAIVALLAKLGVLDDVFNAVKTAVVAAAKGIATGVSAAFKAVIGAVGDAASAVFDAGEAVGSALLDGLTSVFGAIRDAARAVIERVVAIIRGYVDAYRAAGTAVFTALRNGIASVAGAIRDAARSILTAVMGIVRGFADNALSAGAHVFIGVARGFASLAQTVYTVARTVLREAMGVVRGFADNAVDAGAHVFIGVARGFADVAQRVYSMARGIVNNALDVIRGLADAFYDAGKSLVQALARGIADAAGAVIEQAKSLARRVRDILPFSEPRDPSSPFRGLDKSGEAIVANLARGVASAGPLLAQALAGAASGLTVQAAGGVATPGVSPGLGDLSSALRSMPQGSTVGPTVNVHVSSLVPADSASLALIREVVTEALSRGGYREAKVQVIGG